MARARMLHPNFFSDGELLSLSPLHRLLFAGLWGLADRKGILEDKPVEIRIRVLPADNCDVAAMLSDLERVGRIIRYEVDGLRLLLIKNFMKYQHPHVREQPSVLPGPPSPRKHSKQASTKSTTLVGGKPGGDGDGDGDGDGVEAFAGSPENGDPPAQTDLGLAPEPTAPPKPEKPPQESAPPPDGLKPLTERMVAIYVQERHAPYLHRGAADTQALKKVRKIATEGTVLLLWRESLRSTDKWLRTNSFAQFAAKFNDLVDAHRRMSA